MNAFCLPTQNARRLNAVWQIFAPSFPTHKSRSPVCWEEAGLPKSLEGPVEYCCRFRARDLNPSKRYWLWFAGASYETIGWLNNQPLGTHRGIWDSFAWEITPAIQAHNELRLSITKNGGKRFPTARVLSGFLPYVSTSFGGLWGDVYWAETGAVAIHEFYAVGKVDGTVQVELYLDGFGSGIAQVKVFDGLGDEVASAEQHYHCEGNQRLIFQLQVKDPTLWSVEHPTLYRLQATVFVEGERSHQAEQTCGFREVQAQHARILLNGEPFYLRGLLHWGWYPDRLCPRPGAQAVSELDALQSLGYNAIKTCLWVPPKSFLDACDRHGIVVWMELPLWLPEINSEAEFQRVYQEYEAILRQIRSHPSVLLYTLGCELSERFPAEWLQRLYTLTKSLTDSSLVRDNSGGSECYGGALKEYADFYDYHLYCDLHYAKPAFEHFLPGLRQPRPWLQGEFCDIDGYRDFERLRERLSPERLWWLSQDPAINPQGARWLYEAPLIEERLQAAGIAHRRAEMMRSSRGQALAHHKYTLETMRAYPQTSGYVVTGLRDTPVSTSGLLDDFGKAKFDPAIYQQFNADEVLLIDWRKRRVWIGGDRPANADEWNHFGGQTLYPTIALSHNRLHVSKETLRWEFRLGTKRIQGEMIVQVEGSPLASLAALEIPVPKVKTARKGVLSISLGTVHNSWNLWIYPRPDWRHLEETGLYDPEARFANFSGFAGMKLVTGKRSAAKTRRLCATRWKDWMQAYVEKGGRLLLLLQGEGTGLPTESLPFWREAFRLFEPHVLWRSLPHEGFTDLQFLAFSADYALNRQGIQEVFGAGAEYRSLLARIDSRTGYTHDYLAEVYAGKGHALLTTFHFAGANGTSPLTLNDHPAGQAFLWAALNLD